MERASARACNRAGPLCRPATAAQGGIDSASGAGVWHALHRPGCLGCTAPAGSKSERPGPTTKKLPLAGSCSASRPAGSVAKGVLAGLWAGALANARDESTTTAAAGAVPAAPATAVLTPVVARVVLLQTISRAEGYGVC